MANPVDFSQFVDDEDLIVSRSLQRCRSSFVDPTVSSIPKLPSSESITGFVKNFIVPVGSASLMITGNTVGAGMLVLPELAAGPGMTLSTAIFFVAWFMNLVSGLTIAQVAIQQHETSGSEVPSSFKEFAEATLGVNAASAVSGVSIFINSLVLAFDVFKAGQVGDSLIESAGITNSLDMSVFSIFWVAILGTVVASQRLETLSQIASILVMGLFGTFAALLLPGLAHLSDPMAGLASPPTLQGGTDLIEGIFKMVPVVITTLVFQNIVPSITRLLKYDRANIICALVVGSIIPLIMYLSWCTTILGGGISGEGMVSGGLMLSAFSLITVGGSSLGSLVSLSEELSIILGLEKKETFSIPSVTLPIVGALLIGQVFSSDITSLLKIAGSFGSPILYGAIPVGMAWTQLKQSRSSDDWMTAKDETQSRSLQSRKSISSLISNDDSIRSVVPGGILGLALLGLGSTALVGSELVETISQHTAVV
jgi:hypothetical protein